MQCTEIPLDSLCCEITTSFCNRGTPKKILTLVEASWKGPRLEEIHTEEPVQLCTACQGPKQACNQRGLGQLWEYCQEDEASEYMKRCHILLLFKTSLASACTLHVEVQCYILENCGLKGWAENWLDPIQCE